MSITSEKELLQHDVHVAQLTYIIENWYLNVDGIQDRYDDLNLYLEEIYEKEHINNLEFVGFDHHDDTGLTSVTFIATDSQIHITGFAGTNLVKEEWKKDVLADVSIIAGINLQSIAADEYIANLLATYPDAQHHLTAHSLGVAIGYDIGKNYNLSIYGFNGAPGSFIFDYKLREKEYSQFMINFAKKNDFLHLATSIPTAFNNHLFRNQNTYVLESGGGHDLAKFNEGHIIGQMATVIAIQKGVFPERFIQKIPLDSNGDGIIDGYSVRFPEDNIAYNLLSDDRRSSGAQHLEINAESLMHLSVNIRNLQEEALENQIKSDILYAQAKNKVLQGNYQPRVEQAEQAILDQYQDAGFNRVMLQLTESFDLLFMETTEGRKNIDAIHTLAAMNVDRIAQKFWDDHRHYWKIANTSQKWFKEEFIAYLNRICKSAQGIADLMHGIQYRDTCPPQSNKKGMQVAVSTGELMYFFDTIPKKITEVLAGLGNRAQFIDGIVNGLEQVFEVMLKNNQGLVEQFINTSEIAQKMAENFVAVDIDIAKALDTKTVPKIKSNSTPSTYELYLKTSGVFEDVHVIKARDQQIEEQVSMITSYLITNTRSIFEELKTAMKPFIHAFDSFRTDIEELLSLSELRVVQMKIIDNPKYDSNDPLSIEQKEIEVNNKILGQSFGEMDAIHYVYQHMLHLGTEIAAAAGMIDGFLLEYDNLTIYMKKITEQAIYESAGMEDILLLNQAIIVKLEQITKQFQLLQADLACTNQSAAIQELSSYLQVVQCNVSYFLQMVKDCFGINL